MNVKTLDRVRSIYLCLLTIYTLLREVIPLGAVVGNEFVAYFFFAVGLILIGVTFLVNRDYMSVPRMKTLFVFVLISIISMLFNFKYAFMSNVKAIGWMTLFLFLVYPSGANGLKQEKDRDVTLVFTSAFIASALLVALSIPMYLFDVDYSYINENIIGFYSSQGFSHEFARLWGVFGDANTGAVYSFIALIMSVYLFSKGKNVLVRILIVFTDVLIFMYNVLSGSRTAMVVLLAACAWLVFYPVLKKVKGTTVKRTLLAALSAVVAVVLVFGLYQGMQKTIPYIKLGVKNASSYAVEKNVHSMYNTLYSMERVQSNYIPVDDSGYTDKDGNKDKDKNKNNKLESIDRSDVSEKGDYTNGRIAKWQDAVEIFLASPFVGASPRGSSEFGKVHCPDNDISRYGYAVHNTYLEVLMCVGALGILAVLVLLLSTLKTVLKKTYRKEFSIRFMCASGIVLASVCSAAFLTDIFFNLTFGGLACWFSMGIVNADEKELPEETDKKRVLIYGPKDPVGGVEKIVLDYVGAIVKRHDDISFDFLQYGEGFSLEKQIEELGCRVIYLPSRKKYFKYKKALEKVFEDTRYSAVWGNYSGLTNIDLLVLAKSYQVPVRIAHSHGSRFYWGNPLMKILVPIMHGYNSLRINNYATSYFACSSVAGEFMFPSQVKNKIELIPNAVDTEHFKPDAQVRKEARAEFNISDSAAVVGHVARMCQIKNQGFLLEAFKETVKKDPEAKLLFVGDGEDRVQIEAKIKELQLEESVILTGQRSDVQRLYQAMDVFVLTSFSEGLSVSSVEAQASGVPCVLPTAVSPETDICGFVRFVSLEKSAGEWAEIILEQARVDAQDVRDRIAGKGYDISSASENLYKRFMNLN